MAVWFFADIEEYTPPSVPYDEWIEDEGLPTEVIHPAGVTTPKMYRRPAFDHTTGAPWTQIELRNGKCLVRMDAASIPLGGQGLGAITGVDSIISDPNADSMRTYFALTAEQGQEIRGMKFGRAIYHLMLVKPASRAGFRDLIMGGESLHKEAS